MNQDNGNDIQEFSIGPSSSSILPSDSITHTSWLDQNLFGITSFDGYFRLYKVMMSIQNPCFDLVYEFKYNFPLTHFTFMGNSSLIMIGSCDGKIILIDFKNQSTSGKQNFQIIEKISSHILKLFYVNELQMVFAVSSVDTCIAIDCQKMKKVDQLTSYSEIMDCDLVFPYLVLALSTSKIEFINVENFKRYIKLKK